MSTRMPKRLWVYSGHMTRRSFSSATSRSGHSWRGGISSFVSPLPKMIIPVMVCTCNYVVSHYSLDCEVHIQHSAWQMAGREGRRKGVSLATAHGQHQLTVQVDFVLLTQSLPSILPTPTPLTPWTSRKVSRRDVPDNWWRHKERLRGLTPSNQILWSPPHAPKTFWWFL